MGAVVKIGQGGGINTNHAVTVTVFSDVLCVWAYVAQIRVDELKKHFGDVVQFSYRFMPLFGSTQHRIGEGWADRGGFAGFNKHVQEVCAKFPHVSIHPGVWNDCRPLSSSAPHHYLKASQLYLSEESSLNSDTTGDSIVFERFLWQVRLAFFKDNRDISQVAVLDDIAASCDLSVPKIRKKLDSGEAMAALCRDAELKEAQRIEGSPTFVLNEGRQKLYGNVGYRILEANVQEVLDVGVKAGASWC